jgi:hypothetical protein
MNTTTKAAATAAAQLDTLDGLIKILTTYAKTERDSLNPTSKEWGTAGSLSDMNITIAALIANHDSRYSGTFNQSESRGIDMVLTAAKAACIEGEDELTDDDIRDLLAGAE